MPRVLRTAVLAALATLAACQGLPVDAGNAFPCDFSQPPGVRDTVCNAGDVCGLDGRCTKYLYEGPRFEGPPSLVTTDDTGVKEHPLLLNTPATLLAGEPTGRGALLVRGDAGVHLVTARGQLFPGPAIDDDAVRTLSIFRAGVRLVALGLKEDPFLGSQVVGSAHLITSLLDLRALPRLPLEPVQLNGMPPVTNRARALRVQPTTPPLVQLITPSGTTALRVSGEPGTSLQVAEYPTLTDAGLPGVVDVTAVDRRGATAAAVLLLRESLQLERPDGGFVVLDTFPAVIEGALRVNGASTLLTVARNGSTLSTWQVSTSSEPAQVLQQAWPDCTPCPGLARLLAAAPVPPDEGVAVEALCGELVRGARRLSLFRVTGSQAVERTDPCQREALTLPLDERELPDVLDRVVTSNEQRALNLAGRNGQIWRGETFSSLLPLALERVPRDVTTVRVATDAGVKVTLAAITDRYLALQQVDLGQPVNGFRRIDFAQEFQGVSPPPVIAAIHGVPGWVVLSTGVVVRLLGDEGELPGGASALEFGPRLVTPAGDPIRGSVGGEAWVEADGAVTSFFVAADDGLYFVPSPPGTLSPVPTGSATMTPQLQPEPSVPIRSFALERTPLGTDGRTKARGYLVTSRNVFEWSLGGTPARWAARPLVLAGGEPMEVWFDKPRSALGRVGYTNGQVFTLPGGYQLTEALPASTDGGVVRVLDYENLGGWPVALATSGLFVADWGPLVDGKVQNKFDDGRPNKPMRWRPLTLPPGLASLERDGQPRQGRLFVSSEKTADSRELYSLRLFLDDSVWLVATHSRTP